MFRKRNLNYKKILNQIHSYDEKYRQYKDQEDFRAETCRLRDLASKGESKDKILPEAFSLCMEAVRRVMDISLFDVQLMGGVALHKGRIAEMKTGEGKTVAAVCPAYLNALDGKSVHIVTVNEYLAKRDSEEMGRIFDFLGMTTSYVYSNMSYSDRKTAYMCDIVYGTNSELGFDYLRDHLTPSEANIVQRDHSFVILDEIDSILIDEAKTPLIISGSEGKGIDIFYEVDRFVKGLSRTTNYNPNESKMDKILYEFEGAEEFNGDYILHEKNIMLTEKGARNAERFFGIKNYSDASNAVLAHYINQSLRANYVMRNGVDYMVENGSIVIINESTGRPMDGQKYSDNLHQAIEAKEHVEITKETKTLATISYQNYFRMYSKIAGMTGTAVGSEVEFKDIYGLVIEQIPTNKPMIRVDKEDRLYFSKKAKYEAVVKEIKEIHSTRRPVLIGTPSVEESEIVHSLLKKEGIPHSVLNAKNHALEAKIIAKAGKLDAVTIATNMAGRGTDILLGGDYKKEALWYITEHAGEDNIPPYEDIKESMRVQSLQDKEEIIKLGGLAVIGTERFESRRIDNQLCGRSGRQGDPGSSQFYISLEDSLFQLNGGPFVEKVKMLFPKDEEDNPFSGGAKQVSKLMKKAQEKAENANYSRRKNTLEYDDVDNVQRNTFYDARMNVVKAIDEDIINITNGYFDNVLDEIADMDESCIRENIEAYLHTDAQIIGKDRSKYRQEVKEYISNIFRINEEKIKSINGRYPDFVKYIILNIMDTLWTEYLSSISALKISVNMTGMGSLQPIQRYKLEAVSMFNEMMRRIERNTIQYLALTRIKEPAPAEEKQGMAV